MSQIGHSNPSLVPGSGVSHANKNTPIQELSAPTAGGSVSHLSFCVALPSTLVKLFFASDTVVPQGIAENKPAATDIGINTQKLTGAVH